MTPGSMWDLLDGWICSARTPAQEFARFATSAIAAGLLLSALVVIFIVGLLTHPWITAAVLLAGLWRFLMWVLS